MDMEQTMVPQIDGTNPNPTPDAEALSLPSGSTMEQLQAVAKELGVQVDASGNVAETAQPATPKAEAQPTPKPPEQPQAAQPPAPVEVPKKFQNPDGTVNEEKLVQSTKSVEEMVQYYKAKEREAQQLQNRVNNPPPAQVQAVQPVAQPVMPNQLQPLEIQVANDILSETAALKSQGYDQAQAQAIATARVQVRLQEARLNAESSVTADLRREFDESRLTQELQDLISKDKELLSPETADRVVALRNELRQSNPRASYRDAFILHLGQLELQKRTGQVVTPNPTGSTAKAPPTPVGPVSRVLPSVDLGNPKGLSDEQLTAEIRKIHPRFRG